MRTSIYQSRYKVIPNQNGLGKKYQFLCKNYNSIKTDYDLYYSDSKVIINSKSIKTSFRQSFSEEINGIKFFTPFRIRMCYFVATIATALLFWPISFELIMLNPWFLIRFSADISVSVLDDAGGLP